jgi:hypothetical protein
MVPLLAACVHPIPPSVTLGLPDLATGSDETAQFLWRFRRVRDPEGDASLQGLAPGVRGGCEVVEGHLVVLVELDPERAPIPVGFSCALGAEALWVDLGWLRTLPTPEPMR